MTSPSTPLERQCASCGVAFYETREVKSEFCSKCEAKLQNKKALRVVFWVIAGGNLAVVLVLLFFYLVLK
jgi:predicted nucleic acid-binding Zn ribbon protein